MTVVSNEPIFDDLLDIHAFVEVAANQSFTEAARKLDQPRATISRRITRLEDRTRTRLFERTTRTVQITDAGSLLLDHARRILEEMEGARTSLEHLSATPTGPLRITAPIILGQALLGPVIAEFIDRFPDCHPTLSLANANLDLVADGYDVAFRVGSLEDSSLIAKRLGLVEQALYASPEAAFDIKSPADLQDLPLLRLSMRDTEHLPLALTDKNGKIHSVRVNQRLQSSDPAPLAETALLNMGIATLPTFTGAKYVREGKLISILPEFSVHTSEVHILIPSRRYLRPAVRAFVDFAAGRLSTILGSR